MTASTGLTVPTTLDTATSDPSADSELLQVGDDIQPGRYVSEGPSQSCYWEVSTGPSGTFADVRANGFLPGGRLVLDLLDSDTDVRTVGCAEWRPYTAPELPAEWFGPGDWAVGTDVAAGRYRAAPDSAGLACEWERASGFTHNADETIEQGDGPGEVVVDLVVGERFTARACTWDLVR